MIEISRRVSALSRYTNDTNDICHLKGMYGALTPPSLSVCFLAHALAGISVEKQRHVPGKSISPPGDDLTSAAIASQSFWYHNDFE